MVGRRYLFPPTVFCGVLTVRGVPGGLPKGSEPYWPVWLTGIDPAGGKLIYGFGLDFLRYMAFQDDPGENYRAADFDFDKDPPRPSLTRSAFFATNQAGHRSLRLSPGDRRRRWGRAPEQQLIR